MKDDDAALPQRENYPPVGAWGPDVLGPGFQARTLELLPDDTDDGAVATLVRYRPEYDPQALQGTPSSPTFALLYVHGWNDYFFQTHLAREVARLGGAFYALDLRRYGRSLRPGQLHGWCTSLSTYDEELSLALSVIRAEQGAQTGLVLAGHSTGGLVAALWADAHPGALHALVLNSPWLEMQGSSLTRVLGEPLVSTLARRDPQRELIPQGKESSRFFTTFDGWDFQCEGELPDPAWADDPYVTGWNVNWDWRLRPNAPIRAGWLRAVLEGQGRVARGLKISCPVLVMASARTHLGMRLSEHSRSSDTVIDADATALRAVKLGDLVTVARFDGGLHDLTLSAPPVRAQVFAALRRWLGAYVLR